MIIKDRSFYEQIWINTNDYERSWKRIEMKNYCWFKFILQETSQNNEYLCDRLEFFLGIKVFIADKKRVKTTSNKYKKSRYVTAVDKLFLLFSCREYSWVLLIFHVLVDTLKSNFYAKYEMRARVGWIRISHLKKPFRVWENGDSLKIFNFWDVKKL